ncbi:MAG: APC family permease [Deltaproteobacteria bacterium]|nr:APC family permease [Deltaproteobacteria bacterium]MBI3294928.1 APC family permease [Deltaproteobacteria bacterium]
MASKDRLVPELSFLPAMALVIGATIGSGIFVCTTDMAHSLPSGPWVIGVWIAAGLMTLLGALSLSELATLIPETGGPYAFLRRAYGESWGFAFGWANLAVAGSGGIAGTAYLTASCVNAFVPLPHLGAELERWSIHIPYLGDIFPLAQFGLKSVSALIIAFLTGINVVGIRLGAWVQSISTGLKLVLILGIIAVAYALGAQATFPPMAAAPAMPVGAALITAIAAALSSAFWAYDGWANLSYVSGEIKNSARIVPRAIVTGTLIVIVVYTLINIAYFRVLPVENILGSPEGNVGAAMVEAIVGKGGALFVTALILLSVFDCTNAGILTSARVYYAMAADGCFPKRLSSIHPKFSSPHIALWVQMFFSVVLVFTGSFELIASMYVFVNWLFYLLLVCAVFVLRRRMGGTPSTGYRTPLYPWPPLLFALFSTGFLIATLIGDIQSYVSGREPIIKSLAGLILLLAGYPFYRMWKRANLR